MKIKGIYIIVISILILIGISVYSTYALFKSSSNLSNAIYLSTDMDITYDLSTYKNFYMPGSSSVIVNIKVENTSNQDRHYEIYDNIPLTNNLVSVSEVVSDINITPVAIKTSGTIKKNESIVVPIIIINSGATGINVIIGVDNTDVGTNINYTNFKYLTNSKLITKTYSENNCIEVDNQRYCEVSDYTELELPDAPPKITFIVTSGTMQANDGYQTAITVAVTCKSKSNITSYTVTNDVSQSGTLVTDNDDKKVQTIGLSGVGTARKITASCTNELGLITEKTQSYKIYVYSSASVCGSYYGSCSSCGYSSCSSCGCASGALYQYSGQYTCISQISGTENYSGTCSSTGSSPTYHPGCPIKFNVGASCTGTLISCTTYSSCSACGYASCSACGIYYYSCWHT